MSREHKARWLSRFCIQVLLSLPLLLAIGCRNHRSCERQWTLMFYINGISTDLEPYALCAFNELSRVGGDSQVAITAQLARPENPISQGFSCPNGGSVPVTEWSGVRRYFVERGTTLDMPFPGQNLSNIEMRSPKALQDFVEWATTNFPAKHYSLVFWDHGIESPRLMILPPSDQLKRGHKNLSFFESLKGKDVPEFHHRFDSPFLSIYRNPQTQQPLLLNSELKSALSNAMGRRKLDIIEFDACLKSMVETAYAMKDSAQIMIASEDKVEAGQWNYEDWISNLKSEPSMSGRRLADAVLRSYIAIHDGDESFQVSQSIIDLSTIEELANEIDRFVETVIKHPQAILLLPNAREKLVLTYSGMNGVDLDFFLQAYQHPQLDSNTHAAELHLRTVLSSVILGNYSNYKSGDQFGSNGLSIYFPKDPTAYENDGDCIGYDETNPSAIEFVKRHRWKQLLLATWNLSNSPLCKASTK